MFLNYFFKDFRNTTKYADNFQLMLDFFPYTMELYKLLKNFQENTVFLMPYNFIYLEVLSYKYLKNP